MSGISHGSALAIAAKFNWKDYKTYCDVGTAQGDTAAQIALANKHLSGMGFDLAEVGPIFEEYVGELGLNGRLKFMAGDFFKGAIPRADVIVMGHILHDWDLPTKKKVVKKMEGFSLSLPATKKVSNYDLNSLDYIQILL